VLSLSHFAVHNDDKSYLSTVFDATVNTYTLYADFGFGATELF
jgi:hypothetical protein